MQIVLGAILIIVAAGMLFRPAVSGNGQRAVARPAVDSRSGICARSACGHGRRRRSDLEWLARINMEAFSCFWPLP
jgi:hypothetical protein